MYTVSVTFRTDYPDDTYIDRELSCQFPSFENVSKFFIKLLSTHVEEDGSYIRCMSVNKVES